MALMTNLARAEMAVAYVESVMKWPAKNKRDDVMHREMHGSKFDLRPGSIRAIRNERDDLAEVGGFWHRSNEPCRNVEYYLTHSDVAQKHGLGVCDELAAIAFKWLVDIHQAPCNVSYYIIYNGVKPFHAFLLLGEQAAPTMRHYFDETQSPASWPMDAVWCDPWRRDWFEIKNDWHRRVRMIARDCGQDFEPPLDCFRAKCQAFSAAADRSSWWRS